MTQEQKNSNIPEGMKKVNTIYPFYEIKGKNKSFHGFFLGWKEISTPFRTSVIWQVAQKDTGEKFCIGETGALKIFREQELVEGEEFYIVCNGKKKSKEKGKQDFWSYDLYKA